MFNLANTSLRAFACIFTFLFFSSSLIKAQSVTIQSYDTKTGQNLTVHSLTSVPAGALLVLTTTNSIDGYSCVVTSSPALTWTKRADASATGSGDAEIWTAVFTAGGSITVTADWPETGPDRIGSVCYVVINQEATLGGASATATLQTAPSRTITTTRTNSIIFCVSNDRNAVNGASRAYRDAATETLYFYDPTYTTSYHYYKPATSITTYTEGLTAPTGQSAGTALLEIRGAGTDTQAPSAITDLSSPSQTSSTINLSWTAATDNVGVTGYDVYVDGVVDGTTTNTTYTVTDLTASTQYSIYVKAKDAANNSTNSNTITPTTSSAAGLTIQSSDTKTGQNLTVHSLTSVPAGALLVLTTTNSIDGYSCVVTSSPSLTWTKRADASATGSGDAEIWTAVFTAGGSITVTADWPETGPDRIGSVCYVVINQEATLGGASATATLQTAPSRTITTTRTNSIIFCVSNDRNAVNGASRAYRDAATETLYFYDPTYTTSYHYYKPATSITTYTEGLTAPTGQSAGTALLEIRGADIDTQAPSAITDLSSPSQTSSTINLSWTAATDNVGVTGYDVYVGGVLNGNTTNTTYTVTGLAASTQYSIYVKAKDAANNSTNSNTITPTTSAAAGLTIQSYDTKTGQNLTVHSLTSVPAGALLVLTTTNSIDGYSCVVTSSPALTWTKRADASATGSGDAEIWTAVFTAGGSITVTADWPETGPDRIGSVCYVVINQEATLGGASATATLQTAPSRTITTTRANSIIFCVSNDRNAVNGASRAYRDAATESLYFYDPTYTTSYHYYKPATSITTYTEGLTAPTGQSAGTALLEIRGADIDTQAPSAITDLSSPSQTSSTINLSWTAATDNVGVTGYDVYVGGVLNGNTTNTTYTVTGLAASTQYSIYVKAKDAANNSTNSNTITPTTVTASGTEIFRMVDTGTCADGWQYLDPDDDTWKCMSKATIVNGSTTTDGYATINGNSALIATTFDGVAIGSSKIIEGYIFENMTNNQNGHGLYLQNITGATVRNCLFLGTSITNPDTTGNRGLVMQFGGGNTIRDNFFNNCRGGIYYLSTSTGNAYIGNNEFLNITGPYSAGQFIAFNFNTGANNIIEDNRGANYYGEAYPEDMISLFGTSGTSGSPTLVQDNYFIGTGPSYSGGGIVSGENGGGSYVTIQRNKLLEPGNYAVGLVVASDHGQLLDNYSYQPMKPWSNNAVLCFDSPTNANVQGNKAYSIFGHNPLCPPCTPGANNPQYYNDYGILPGGEVNNPTTYGTTQEEAAAALALFMADGFPVPLLTFITEDEVWQLRASKTYADHIIYWANRQDGVARRRIERPTANAPADQSISTSTTTLVGTGTPLPAGENVIASYLWQFVSGPATPSIVSPNSSTTNITGMSVSGTYRFRFIVSQENYLNLYPTEDVFTSHADWVEVTVASGRFSNPITTEDIKNIPYNNSNPEEQQKLDEKRVYGLRQNYPNPFNKGTTIQFTLPKAEKVNLSLFDVSGRVVKVLVNSSKDAGTHTVNFNAGSFAKGVYYYRMQAGDFTDVKKLTIQ